MRKKVVRTSAEIELHQAAMQGDIAAMRQAIAEGANVNAPDEEHYITPLLWACYSESLDAVVFLVNAGAQVNYADENLDTPLYNAIGKGHVEMVKFLIDSGANWHVLDGCGFTALEAAVAYETAFLDSRIQIVDLILSLGYDVNAPCALPDKRTPLMTAIEGAAQTGDVRMARHLLSRGADVNATDKDGLKAADYANWGEHKAAALAVLEE